MSDLDGTLSAITLEHLNAAGGPRRATITADGCTYFARDTITEYHPIYGVHESRRWVKDRRTTRDGCPMTARQMVVLSASMEHCGWQEIASAYHGGPSVGRIQR